MSGHRTRSESKQVSVQHLSREHFPAARNEKQGAIANRSGEVRKGVHLVFSAFEQFADQPLMGFPN